MTNEVAAHKTATDSRIGLRKLLWGILVFSTVAALTEIFLALTQDCLNEILLALGVANGLIAGGTATYLQKRQGDEEDDDPVT